jgi:hypothetical protein
MALLHTKICRFHIPQAGRLGTSGESPAMGVVGGLNLVTRIGWHGPSTLGADDSRSTTFEWRAA